MRTSPIFGFALAGVLLMGVATLRAAPILESMLIDQVIRDLEEDSRRFREHELVPISLRRPH